MAADYDILVAGGGVVGSAFAALAVRRGVVPADRIAVIERDPPPRWKREDPPDLRVYAISRASMAVLAEAGAWETIAGARISPYERMHVWPELLEFDAAELGEPDLGAIVESRLIQHALAEALARLGVALLHARLDGAEFEPDRARVVVDGEKLSARLLVGADGGQSRVREWAGFETRRHAFGQHAIVANVATSIPHQRTAWQRFLGHGTLAFLPLSSGESSIVWSVLDAEAERLKGLSVTRFEEELTEALEGKLGEVTLRSGRVAIPLQSIMAMRYARERCVLIGDAAHTVHPLAGQGVNLGFLDAAALVDALATAREEREDPGALRILRRYERARRPENKLMGDSLEAINQWLALGSGPVARLAQRGLGTVNRIGPLKRALALHALTGGASGRSSPRR